MKAKVTLTTESGEVRHVEPLGDVGAVDGACPHCQAPLRIQGERKFIESHDTYASRSHCVACKAFVGICRAQVNTIFGLAEDEAVLYGRPRVY